MAGKGSGVKRSMTIKGISVRLEFEREKVSDPKLPTLLQIVIAEYAYNNKLEMGGGIYRGIVNFYFKKVVDWDKMVYGLYPPPDAYKGIIIPAYRRAEIENDLTFL